MNDSTKSVLVAILILTTIFSGVALAAWIYSSVVTINVTQSTISLSYSSLELTVTFTGTVRDGQGNGVAGQTVYIYQTDNVAGDNPIERTTAITDSSGNYIATYNVPSIGTYYFRAGTLI